MIHNPKWCRTCRALRQRVLDGDPGLVCVHHGDPCELCLTSRADRIEAARRADR